MDAIGEVGHLGLELVGVAEGVDAPGGEPLAHVGPRHDQPEAGAGEDTREDVGDEAKAVALVGARLEGGAEGEKGAALAEGGWVVAAAAFAVDGPAGGESLALATRDLELAAGDGGRGHVEGEGLATGDRGGEGEGVRAESALGASGGDGEHRRVAARHANQAVVGGALGVVPGSAEVASVADGDHADATRLGAGDAAVHGVGGDNDAHAAVSIEGEGSGCLAEDADGGCRVHAAVAQAGHVAAVPGEVGDAVGLDALQVGVDEDVGGGDGIGGGHAEVLERAGHVVAEGGRVEAVAGVGHRGDCPRRQAGTRAQAAG